MYNLLPRKTYEFVVTETGISSNLLFTWKLFISGSFFLNISDIQSISWRLNAFLTLIFWNKMFCNEISDNIYRFWHMTHILCRKLDTVRVMLDYGRVCHSRCWPHWLSSVNRCNWRWHVLLLQFSSSLALPLSKFLFIVVLHRYSYWRALECNFYIRKLTSNFMVPSSNDLSSLLGEPFNACPIDLRIFGELKRGILLLECAIDILRGFSAIGVMVSIFGTYIQ